MKRYIVILTLGLITSFAAHASEDSRLLQKLKEIKFSLTDAISYAEKTSGPATSAKFEMDGDELVFSVYTAPQGLSVSPEETDLTELSGAATALPITAKAEIFSDKEHLTRASTHLTLMQLSPFSLKQIIQKASGTQAGIVYSIKNPMVRDHKAVADISILKSDGSVVTVTVNLLSGGVTGCN